MLYKEYKTNYKQLMPLKKPLSVFKKVVLFLLGGYFYYSALYIKKSRGAEGYEIGAALFSSKTLAFILMAIYLKVSNLEVPHGVLNYFGTAAICFIIAYALYHIIYIKLKALYRLDIFFLENISTRLDIIGCIYALALDITIILSALILMDNE